MQVTEAGTFRRGGPLWKSRPRVPDRPWRVGFRPFRTCLRFRISMGNGAEGTGLESERCPGSGYDRRVCRSEAFNLPSREVIRWQVRKGWVEPVMARECFFQSIAPRSPSDPRRVPDAVKANVRESADLAIGDSLFCRRTSFIKARFLMADTLGIHAHHLHQDRQGWSHAVLHHP